MGIASPALVVSKIMLRVPRDGKKKPFCLPVSLSDFRSIFFQEAPNKTFVLFRILSLRSDFFQDALKANFLANSVKSRTM